MSEGTLIDKLLARARKDPANAVELRKMAADLDAAVKDSRLPPKQLLATWARIRRRWCEISGEPVMPATTSKVASVLFRMLQPR